MTALNARPGTLALLVFLLLLAAMFPGAAVLAGTGDISITVNGQLLSPDVPPLLQGNRLLFPARPLAEALQARVTWNEASRTAVVTTSQTTILFKLDSKEVVKDGEKLSLDVPVQVSRGHIMVPLRFLAEALGAEVAWDERNLAATISTPPAPVPERVYSGAFPARVAFTSNNNLWLLDGSQAGAQPVQVTKEGSAEFLGWSPDGQWLAYLQRETPEEWAAKPYLWVVKADGSGAIQVDQRPVLGTPAWSSAANTLAYSTDGPGGGYAPDMNLKLATIVDGKVKVTALLPDKSELVQDFAWAPDGHSLAVSLQCTEDHPLRIDRINLQGERSNLLTLGEAGITLGEVYPSFATGLRWSPNGRYLAYYLHPNSASLAADGVQLQVLDLKQPGKPLDLGTSLQYRQWLAWSPDGDKLAFIQGGNREATYNKRLCTVTLPAGKITFYDVPGKVDTQPLWLPTPREGVLFCRGLERMDWGGQSQSEVLVSDHRIWLAANDGQARPLTAGTPDNADYYPSVSSDGQNLYFLRLQSATSGSLYQQPLANGTTVELVRNLSGGVGYYGNYYPAWVSICHLNPEKLTRITGRLSISNLEGRHFELDTDRSVLVLLPEKGVPSLAVELEKYAGQRVTVEGTITNEPNIYMRGPVMQVRSVSPAGNAEAYQP